MIWAVCAAVSGPVALIVPVKGLVAGKSRLRGGIEGDHAELVLALAMDTVAAAAATDRVRRVLVVTPDPAVTDAARVLGVDVLPERPPHGLNSALQQGYALLRDADPATVVGALQADLPSLDPAELSEAIAEAGGRRAFCRDRQGSGTTLLLSAAGGALAPSFGPMSARTHAASGAAELRAAVPSIRCDVDTADDLAAAATMRLGPRTAALLRPA